MEEIILLEEEMPTSKGYITHKPLQQLSQEAEQAATEAGGPTRKYSRLWKASYRALESREQESLNCNTAFTSVQDQEEGQQYYEVMNKESYRIKYEMEDLLNYLASSDPDTIYFAQEMKHTA